MDIHKIVSKSIDDTIARMINKDNSIDLPEPPEELKENAELVKILMDYSNSLLKNYNDELSKILSSHGIQL